MKLLNVKSVSEVENIIREHFVPLDRLEYLTIDECLGRVLGEDLYSPEILPPFSRSSVDGYAVIASDTYGANDSIPAFLDLREEIKMGDAAGEIQVGEASYIPTGGMLPQGANAVIMVEFTEKLGSQVMLYRQVAPGENVINAGDDVKKDEIVLKKGTILNESEIGVLAALGFKEVMVYEKPVVAILSTGNELVPYYQDNLKNGQIRDINSLTIASLAKKYGAEIIQGGIARDDLSEIIKKAEELLAKSDVLILSGGSSVGVLDFTAQVVKSLGTGTLLIEGISVKPGKPTLLSRSGNKAILGLPGHPVSALMIFNYFGSQLLNIISGVTKKALNPTVKGLLTRNIPSSAGRTDWIRAKLSFEEGFYAVTPIFGKSGLIKTLSDSDGFIIIPPAKEGLEAGNWVEVILWN